MHRDDGWIGFRREGEVVFQLLIAAVVNEGHAFIDGAVLNLGEGRHAALPLGGIVPEQIVDATGELFEAAGSRVEFRALESHAHEANAGLVRRAAADERA